MVDPIRIGISGASVRMKAFRLGYLASWTLIAAPAFASEAQTFTYDTLGRLVKISKTGDVNDGQTTTILLDRTGNRVNYAVTGASESSDEMVGATLPESKPQYFFNGLFISMAR